MITLKPQLPTAQHNPSMWVKGGLQGCSLPRLTERLSTLMKEVTARQHAADLRTCIWRNLATDVQPELSDVRIVWGRADLDPRMPGFLVAFLEEAWRSEQLT